MAKSFISKIKNLFSSDTPHLITRSFAIRMLPLSFLAGIFISVAIPASYYYLERVNTEKEAEIYANDVASFFIKELETNPLTWEQELNSKLSLANIGYVEIFDRNHNPITQLTTSHLHKNSWLAVETEAKVISGGTTYAIVKVVADMTNIEKNTIILLLFSLICGTITGVTLFLLPTFKIQSTQNKVNRSHQKLIDRQNELKISEEKFRTFFGSTPDGTFISTKSGEILSANHAFLEMFQIDRKELSSIKAAELYCDPATREKVMDILKETGKLNNVEVLYRKKDDSELPALVSINLINMPVPVADKPGHTEERDILLTVIKDISKIKEVERQLIKAQKMESIGMLAGGIAHDFNNLLTGVMGYASLIKMKTGEDDELHEFARTIEKAALRGSDLTGKLLAFTRGGKYIVTNVNLNEIAEEVLAILKHTIEKKIVISKELAPDLKNVLADASQINQVLLNLCVNARDAMAGLNACKLSEYKLAIKTFNTRLEKRSFIAGVACHPGEYAVISVTDTGAGMSPETLVKIFDPFFSTKEKGRRTGLGLSVVYGIIKHHEGYIDIISEQGKGTSFVIYLPVSKDKEKGEGEDILASENRGENKEGDRAGTILIVDDEVAVRDIGKNLFEQRGYTVLLAKDGEEGISVYKANHDKIDIVLLDMIMPNKNGNEVFYELIKTNPSVKVIMISGFSLDNEAQKLLNDGALTFIQKPYQAEELLQTVRKILGQT